MRLSETASDLDVSLDDLALAWEMDIRGDGSGNLGIGNIDLRAGELRENGALKPFNFEIASRVVTLRESSFDLSALRATVEGEIGLPAPPRSGQSRPLTYALTLRGGVDLPKLGQVLPTLPKLEGKVEFSAGLSDQVR